jgi:hypothetical protein
MIFFNKQDWLHVKMIWRKIRLLASEWSILCKDQRREEMKSWLSFLELHIREPLKISSD